VEVSTIANLTVNRNPKGIELDATSIHQGFVVREVIEEGYDLCEDPVKAAGSAESFEKYQPELVEDVLKGNIQGDVAEGSTKSSPRNLDFIEEETNQVDILTVPGNSSGQKRPKKSGIPKLVVEARCGRDHVDQNVMDGMNVDLETTSGDVADEDHPQPAPTTSGGDVLQLTPSTTTGPPDESGIDVALLWSGGFISVVFTVASGLCYFFARVPTN